MRTEPGSASLTITRRIKAPPAQVYSAWTEPAKLMRWFGPDGADLLHVEADARVGGRYRVLMRMPDGAEHEASGVYRQVVPDEKLVFTWTWGSTPERETLVTVLIRGDGDGTRLTLMHERLFDELDRDNHRSGWTEAVGNLERFLTSPWKQESPMLGDKDAVVTIAVKDLEAAGKFYQGTLGLKQVPTGEAGVLGYQSGNSSVLVYQSQYAGTNEATAATWVLGDGLEGIVRALKAKGVAFEHYDLPGTTREGDVHVSGSMRAAWFKDPDGNILALVSG